MVCQAGLGVWIVSPKAVDKAQAILSSGASIGSYNALPLVATKSHDWQTLETPNVLAIHLLAKITKDMIDYGLENIRTESKIKAKLIYNYFDNHPHIKPYV